jgi:hypothetical protein
MANTQLSPKHPSARQAYSLDASSWLLSGAVLGAIVAGDVSVADSDPAQSPIALRVTGAIALGTTGVQFNLEGGTPGYSYTIAWALRDNASPERNTVMYAVVQVTEGSLLVVEDGTVVAGANSYVSIAEADTYYNVLQDTVWQLATTDAKIGALVRAAYYMQQRFRLKWKGARIDANQKLDWPRTGVDVPDFFDPFYTNSNFPLNFQDILFIGTSTIPDIVKQAQIILARLTLDAASAPTVSLQDTLGRATKVEQVGSLMVEYMSAADGAVVRQTQFYWEVEELLRPFMKPAQLSGRVSRC